LRPPPRFTLFPYTTLFRSAKRGTKTTSMSKTTSGTKTASEIRRKQHRGGLNGADGSEPVSDEIPVGHPFAYPVLSPQAMPHCPRSEEHTSELQSPCNLVCR